MDKKPANVKTVAFRNPEMFEKTKAIEYFYDTFPEDLVITLQRACLDGCFTREEEERQRQGAQRLKEQLSPIPWYREQAEKDGEIFWRRLHDSCILS